LFPLYNHTIAFNKSHDLQKCIRLTYFFAIVVLLLSNLPLYCIMISGGILISFYRYTYKLTASTMPFTQLACHPNHKGPSSAPSRSSHGLLDGLMAAPGFMEQPTKSPLEVKNRKTATNKWILEDTKGTQQIFDEMHIQFDGGIFLMLLLSNQSFKKRLIIFNDQITPDDHRLLKTISRIR
jgi:hypothetical protein